MKIEEMDGNNASYTGNDEILGLHIISILESHGTKKEDEADATGDLESREKEQTKGMLMIEREPSELNLPYPSLVWKT